MASFLQYLANDRMKVSLDSTRDTFIRLKLETRALSTILLNASHYIYILNNSVYCWTKFTVDNSLGDVHKNTKAADIFFRN